MYLVEDGSVVAGANAYVDVAFADTYHLDRGHGSWAALTSTAKQQAIIRATDYVDKRFGRRWRGRKIQPLAQPLLWPRVDVYDPYKDLLVQSNVIPAQLKKAVSEYALRAALLGELAPDPLPQVPRQDLSPNTPVFPTEFQGGQIRRVAEKVDVIETSTSYNTPDNLTSAQRSKAVLSGLVTEAFIPEYPAADLLLEELLRTGERTLARA